MEIYEIKTTCDAKVIETWHVKAGSFDEAATAFDPGSEFEKEFVFERTNDEKTASSYRSKAASIPVRRRTRAASSTRSLIATS